MGSEETHIKKDRASFTPYQRKILFLCIFAYFCIYIMRLNLSVANPFIRADLKFTPEMMGVISSCFLWCYAIGQLISGRLGDIFPAKWMIATGLSVSLACNFVMGITSEFAVMVVAWLINGCFQSLLWSPIIKCIAMNFEGRVRTKASIILSVSLACGYASSWGASSLLGGFLSWRYIFIVPAAIAAIYLIIWIIFFKEDPEQYVANAKQAVKAKAPLRSILKNRIVVAMIIISVISAVAHGIIKESISSWLPTMMTDTGIFSTESTFGILFVVPMLNFIGIMFSNYSLSKKKSDAYAAAIPVLITSTVACALPIIFRFILGDSAYTIVLLVLTILIFVLMAALNPFFVTFLPLSYDKYGLVSTMTGVFDFAVYLGASFSSLLTGVLYGKNSSWNGVTAMWAISMVVCILSFVAVSLLHKKRD